MYKTIKSLIPISYLQKGDTIGLVSPSSSIKPGEIDLGIQFLEKNGFKIKLGDHINDVDRFLAGKDEDRAKDIMNFFKDPEIKAIIATSGGQGSQRLLPLLDYEIIAHNPKILVGFSDTTALQLGLLKKIDLISYTGFTLTLKRNSFVEETLFSCLLGKPYSITKGIIPVNPGNVEGKLVGGNLTLLTNLMGTPYQPNFKGNILLLEEVGVEPYNVDGMFSQLDLAGVFDQISGIIIGEFENCTGHESSGEQGSVEDVINEWTSRCKIPCIKNFPYGHGDRNCVLPLGGNIILNADNSSVTVAI
jgi:muramoyltetrapeptide carboxypeptidase